MLINLQFHHAADAKKALEQLNGFELAGRPMKVGNVTAHLEANSGYHRFDTDELDRAGIDLSATGRLQLMFKLAEGSGLQVCFNNYTYLFQSSVIFYILQILF